MGWCLLLGLMTTVGVAWLCSIFAALNSTHVTGMGVTHDEAPCWRLWHSDSWALRRTTILPCLSERGRRIFVRQLDSRGVRLEPHDLPQPWPEAIHRAPTVDEPLRQQTVICAGWPWPALCWQYEKRQGSTGWEEVTKDALTWKQHPLPTLEAHLALPLRPLPGLAADTAVFGVAWAILLALRSIVQRRIPAIAPRAAVVSLVPITVVGVAITIAIATVSALATDLSHATLDRSRAVTDTHPECRFWKVTMASSATAARVESVVQWHHEGTTDVSTVPLASPETVLPVWAAELRPDRARQDERMQELRYIDAHGWPRLAMKALFSVELVQIDDRHLYRARDCDGVAIHSEPAGASRFQDIRILPLRLIWRGFLFNIAFFVGVIALATMLFLGPGIIPRSIRARRGQCIFCGYDLRYGSGERCPECGRRTFKPA